MRIAGDKSPAYRTHGKTSVFPDLPVFVVFLK
jgi:hypothetical protein